MSTTWSNQWYSESFLNGFSRSHHIERNISDPENFLTIKAVTADDGFIVLVPCFRSQPSVMWALHIRQTWRGAKKPCDCGEMQDDPPGTTSSASSGGLSRISSRLWSQITRGNGTLLYHYRWRKEVLPLRSIMIWLFTGMVIFRASQYPQSFHLQLALQ